MKRLAMFLACGAALAAATPTLAQTVVTREYVGPAPYYDGYGNRWDGPYAYAPRERYVYGYDGPAQIVVPARPGYWAYGRYWNCTQSATPNRPDRTASSSNVTEQCF